ncbi:MAG: alpha/beta fold hydrolase, partial [Ilumatobacteraceae bacterium]
LPGFGCATPAGFGATKEEYADWFTAELESIAASSGPVDLVGHDWGGAIAMYVAAQRPDLIRTWACDVLGVFHPDYVWHQFAQIWQTPGDGEAFFEQNLATPVADRVAVYEQIGIPRATAEQFVAAGDAEMARCVLALYRSAAQPATAEWGRQLGGAATRPGLAIIAPDDPFVRSLDLAPLVAEQLGARQQVMEGQGHWWMLSDPKRGARVLTEFWESV